MILASSGWTLCNSDNFVTIGLFEKRRSFFAACRFWIPQEREWREEALKAAMVVNEQTPLLFNFTVALDYFI